MSNIPKTSVSLLNAIAASRESSRWNDFYERYQPVMEAFLRGRFPALEAEDIIQAAMIAFMKRVPNYKYNPDLNGSFHNYLLGITKYKALETLRSRNREAVVLDDYGKETKTLHAGAEAPGEPGFNDEDIARLAIQQYLNDDAVSTREHEIFRRTALLHEGAESVAEAFGITRNNVDQIKARALKKIRAIAEGLKNLEE